MQNEEELPFLRKQSMVYKDLILIGDELLSSLQLNSLILPMSLKSVDWG